MQYLADTVTLVRHLSKTGKIGKAAKRILEDSEIVKIAASSACKELHDRLILSTAKYLGVAILTSDQVIKDLNEVPTIWQ